MVRADYLRGPDRVGSTYMLPASSPFGKDRDGPPSRERDAGPPTAAYQPATLPTGLWGRSEPRIAGAVGVDLRQVQPYREGDGMDSPPWWGEVCLPFGLWHHSRCELPAEARTLPADESVPVEPL